MKQYELIEECLRPLNAEWAGAHNGNLLPFMWQIRVRIVQRLRFITYYLGM